MTSVITGEARRRGSAAVGVRSTGAAFPGAGNAERCGLGALGVRGALDAAERGIALAPLVALVRPVQTANGAPATRPAVRGATGAGAAGASARAAGPAVRVIRGRTVRRVVAPARRKDGAEHDHDPRERRHARRSYCAHVLAPCAFAATSRPGTASS
jgi:hypothetical protein